MESFFHVFTLYTDAPFGSNKKNCGETLLWIAHVNRVLVHLHKLIIIVFFSLTVESVDGPTRLLHSKYAVNLSLYRSL